MGTEDTRILAYWAPTFVAMGLLAAAGFVLIILESRSQRRRRSGDPK